MADRLKAAALQHPIFEPLRPWLDALAPGGASPEYLSRMAADRGLVNVRGLPVRFAAPETLAPGNYELRVHASGIVATRPGNRHDLLNALAWLAFPRTKAALNAIHAAHIERDGAQRGRVRDALTLFDEGGALVALADATLEPLVRAHRWKELFWDRREDVLACMRILTLGHAVLEHALDPYPGITCRVLFVPVATASLSRPAMELSDALDAAAAGWFRSHPALTPALLPPLPLLGYPGWLDGSDAEAFYADRRYFRPLRAARQQPAA